MCKKNRKFCKPSTFTCYLRIFWTPLWKNNAYRAMHTFYLSILTEIVFCYILKISRFFVRKHLYGVKNLSSRWNRDKNDLKITQLIHCYDRFVKGFSFIHFIGYTIYQCHYLHWNVLLFCSNICFTYAHPNNWFWILD